MSSHQQISFWEAETFTRPRDVVIIGAGLVGINAALTIKQRAPKLNVLLLERGSIPTGASTKNAGFACIGSISEIKDDLSHTSYDDAVALILERYRGLRRLRETVGDRSMDYNPCGGYELFDASDISHYAELMNQLNEDLKAELGARPYQLVNRKQLFSPFGSATFNPIEGSLHPGKMMTTLIAKAKGVGVEFLFGCTVEGWEEMPNHVQLQTGLGLIKAEQIIVATNGLSRPLLPELDITPARNQVLVTKELARMKWQGTFHYDKGYIYFRSIGNRLLLGGARNIDPLTETTADLALNSRIQDHLLHFLQEKLLEGQQIEIDRWWSGILGVGQQKAPIVKRLTSRQVVAVRLGGMGVAIGSLVGEKAAQLLLS